MLNQNPKNESSFLSENVVTKTHWAMVRKTFSPDLLEISTADK
jgi:hypothetical protein